MGRELCGTSKRAQEIFEEASDALGDDLLKICDDKSRLAATIDAQPAILACEIAVYTSFCERTALRPTFGAGHSLGELAALVASGGLTLADGVRLARLRGKVMQEAVPPGEGLMVAVFGADRSFLKQLLDEAEQQNQVVAIANDNASDQLVLSGRSQAVRDVVGKLSKANAVAHELPISIPSHCELMSSAAERFAEALRAVTLRSLEWPIITNVAATMISTPDDYTVALIRQMTSTVHWRTVMATIVDRNPDLVLEVGPKTVLRDLFKLEYPARRARSMETSAEVDRCIADISARPTGSLISVEILQFIKGCLVMSAATKNHNFGSEAAAAAITKKYRYLQSLRQKVAAENDIGVEEVRSAAETLRQLMKLKKVDTNEAKQRLLSLAAGESLRSEIQDIIDAI